MPVRLKPTFAQRLAGADRPLIGLWNATGDPVAAEILATAEPDLLMFDAEHASVSVPQLLTMLQATEASSATPLVRIPWNDPVLIKQFLETGVQNVVVPMVSDVEEAHAAVQSVRYPPYGIRGVGSAFGRASRWGAVDSYVARGNELVSLTVQIETVQAVENLRAIADVQGVDALFIGPTDLSASMGFPGPAAVAELVERTIRDARDAGITIGVNAFDPADADRYLAAGAQFVMVGADVTMLTRGARATLDRARNPSG